MHVTPKEYEHPVVDDDEYDDGESLIPLGEYGQGLRKRLRRHLGLGKKKTKTDQTELTTANKTDEVA